MHPRVRTVHESGRTFAPSLLLAHERARRVRISRLCTVNRYDSATTITESRCPAALRLGEGWSGLTVAVFPSRNLLVRERPVVIQPGYRRVNHKPAGASVPSSPVATPMELAESVEVVDFTSKPEPHCV